MPSIGTKILSVRLELNHDICHHILRCILYHNKCSLLILVRLFPTKFLIKHLAYGMNDFNEFVRKFCKLVLPIIFDYCIF